MGKDKSFHLMLKIVSILIAFGIWIILSGYKQTTLITKTFTVPVYFENISDNIILKRDIVYEVNVQLSGPEKTIKQMTNEDVYLPIDLSDKAYGKHSTPVENYIKVPENVNIIDTVPHTVEYIIEKKIIKRLPVKVKPVGDVFDGYEIKKITAQPPVVTVEGPQSDFSGLYEIVTEPVDVTGKSVSFLAEVYLLPKTSYLKIKNTPVVIANIDIEEKSRTSVFKQIPINLINSKDKTSWVNPKNINVIASGQISYLEQISKEDLEVFIDCKALTSRKDDYILTPVIMYKGNNLEEIRNNVSFRSSPSVVNLRIY